MEIAIPASRILSLRPILHISAIEGAALAVKRWLGVWMDYRIDLDPTHSVICATITAAVLTRELADDCYRSVARIASHGGPYAAIWDLSGVTGMTESASDIKSRAESDPAIPLGRTRVVVAKEPVVYGLSRMLVLMRDTMGGLLQVVHSLEEAYEIVGVRPEDFTEHLFPEDRAA